MGVIKNILKGAAIGGANIIPGLSGGTIAFILGIYEILTESIGEFFICTWEKRKKYIKFLLEIGIGMFVGIILAAKVITIMYESYPDSTSYFFIGLILASLPIILKENKQKISRLGIMYFFIGFGIIMLVIYLDSINTTTQSEITSNTYYYIKLYFCGVLAAAAMVIPGLSGSLLLILSGEYYNILYFVNDRNIPFLLIIIIGAFTGILLITRIIDYLLKNHKNNTIFFIVGLIVASIFGIWPSISSLFVPTNIVSLIFGISLVFFMKKFKK